MMELINAITIYSLTLVAVVFLFYGVPWLAGKRVDPDCIGYDCVNEGIGILLRPMIIFFIVVASVFTLAGLVNFVR